MQVSCKLITERIHRLTRLFCIHPLARRCVSGWIHSVSHLCEIVSYDCNLEQLFFFSELCAAMKIKARSRKESVEIRVILSWHDDSCDVGYTRMWARYFYIIIHVWYLVCIIPRCANCLEYLRVQKLRRQSGAICNKVLLLEYYAAYAIKWTQHCDKYEPRPFPFMAANNDGAISKH